MKQTTLTILALFLTLPAHAGETAPGFPAPRLMLLFGANLVISGILLFLLLVIASAFWDRRKARKRAEFIARRRETRIRSSRSSMRTRKEAMPDRAAG